MKGYRIGIRRTVSTGVYAHLGIPAGEETVLIFLMRPDEPDPAPNIIQHDGTGVVQVVPLFGGDFPTYSEAMGAFGIWLARRAVRLPPIHDDWDQAVDELGVGEKAAAYIRRVLREEREAVERSRNAAGLPRDGGAHDRAIQAWRDSGLEFDEAAEQFGVEEDGQQPLREGVSQRNGKPYRVETLRKLFKKRT